MDHGSKREETGRCNRCREIAGQPFLGNSDKNKNKNKNKNKSKNKKQMRGIFLGGEFRGEEQGSIFFFFFPRRNIF